MKFTKITLALLLTIASVHTFPSKFAIKSLVHKGSVNKRLFN